MKPYYEDTASGITLFQGRAEDVLPNLVFGSVDLVFTSPPYNLSGLRKVHSGSDYNGLNEGYEDHDDAMDPREYMLWQRDVLGWCWELLTPTGAIFYNHKPILRDGVAHLPFEPGESLPLRQVITWDRGAGHINTFWYFTPRYEWILVYAPVDFRLAKLGVFDVWKFSPDQRNDHPAPFPVSLPACAIDAVQPKLVLDPFCGSGTTLVAAKAAGVKAIGIELSESYCDMAASRLAQGSLFG